MFQKNVVWAFLCGIAWASCVPEDVGESLDQEESTIEDNVTADSENVEPQEPEGSTHQNEDSLLQSNENSVLRFDSIEGGFGDIRVSFTLNPTDGHPRDVTLLYSGGCAEEWTEAVVDSHTSTLLPGQHWLVWHSWDQEAGCSATVRLRLETHRDESVLSEPFELRNSGDHSGFFISAQEEQGIDETERERFDVAVAALIDQSSVDFVATRSGDRYEVYASRGTVVFERRQTNSGYEYSVVGVDGDNPIGDQSLDLAATRDRLLEAGGNPNDAALPGLGYPKGDDRLSFIEPEDDAYPFGYERLAAYFDHPDAADFYVNLKGYAHFEQGHAGSHGSLNAAQSTSPFVIFGKGVVPGVYDVPARAVDIAPTVARLLGMPLIEGIDERGIKSARVYLERQDGHVLEELLDGETSERAIILVSDGLTLSLVRWKVESEPKRYPNLSRLWREGAVTASGSIANWPSVTYPGHNVLGSGLWSGHHGLVDNTYYRRSTGKIVSPIDEVFNVEKYFNPERGVGESLHMAVHRAMGNWNKGFEGGSYTASFYDPSVKDADTTDLEGRDRSGKVPFPPVGVSWPSEIPGPDLTLGDTSVTAEQLVEQTCLVELWHLFTNDVSPTPSYVIINLMATDGAGHSFGPLGNKTQKVLERTDALIGLVLRWLEKWGLSDTSTLVFTSDHGMQMGDPTRSFDPLTVLKDVGIETVGDTGLGVYLK